MELTIKTERQIAMINTNRVMTLLTVLLTFACSVTYAQDVRTNYMPGTDFAKFHTYAWVNQVQGVPTVGGHSDQILDTQVRQAIDSQMAAKGFSKVEDSRKADLLVGYQLAIDQEKQINGFGDNLGGWGPGPGGLGSVGRRLRNIFGQYFTQLHRDFRGRYV